MFSDTVTAAIVGAIIGGVLSIIGTLITVHAGRKRKKIISYEVSSIPLLRFNPKENQDLIVSVKKSLLTGNDQDTDLQPVHDAYGFVISLQNSSRDDIETPITIEIRLDDQAKIIRKETFPPESKRKSESYNITKEKGQTPNVVVITAPYINSRDTIQVRLISIENTTQACYIIPATPSIRTLPARKFAGEYVKRYLEFIEILPTPIPIPVPRLSSFLAHITDANKSQENWPSPQE